MISIITPFYHAEKFLNDTILSVLSQTYEDWELLLINDGSPDNSKNIALSHHDPRIRYFEQKNTGVSTARNVGLSNMRGDYFCFLDADDILPANSLKSRFNVFQFDQNIIFVDGVVHKMNSNLSITKFIWRPSLTGNPLSDLVQLGGKSFLGLTWMIKRKKKDTYQMIKGLSHGEDLFFYLQLARDGGLYDYTEDTTLLYRDTPGSAMKNLNGLKNGYRYIESQIKNWPEVSKKDLFTYRFRYRKAMALAFLKQGDINSAINVWV